ncbi:hypothetical protein [Noviherbaspirillum sp.]|uniref:hypothetical protein n=1 Tax=Noviherbaspirillum sp. TaxID=1926288 RepID=UPI002FE06F07
MNVPVKEGDQSNCVDTTAAPTQQAAQALQNALFTDVELSDGDASARSGNAKSLAAASFSAWW